MILLEYKQKLHFFYIRGEYFFFNHVVNTITDGFKNITYIIIFKYISIVLCIYLFAFLAACNNNIADVKISDIHSGQKIVVILDSISHKCPSCIRYANNSNIFIDGGFLNEYSEERSSVHLEISQKIVKSFESAYILRLIGMSH